MTPSGGLVSALAAFGRELTDHAGPPEILADRPDRACVVRVGDVVVKAHPPGTDADALAVRLAAAADPSLDGILLTPRRMPSDGFTAATAGRLVTAWPAGVPVPRHDPEAVPWEDAAALLARLHAVPPSTLPVRLPPAGATARVRRAVATLDEGPSSPTATVVLRAYAGLPELDGGDVLAHGDWHLGQLVRTGYGWRLVDVDDLGVGDPVWDLARPAAWFAAGVLPEEYWQRLLSAYAAHGGTAVPADDPWPVLDVPARALAVQVAALAVVEADRLGAPLDPTGEAFVDACARMT